MKIKLKLSYFPLQEPIHVPMQQVVQWSQQALSSSSSHLQTSSIMLVENQFICLIYGRNVIFLPPATPYVIFYIETLITINLLASYHN